MYIAILGRQPALGMAELEHLYSADAVRWFSDVSACIEADFLSVKNLGGTQKVGRVVAELPHGDWHRVSMKIVQNYTREWANFDGKITLGISVYGFDVDTRDIQKTGIVLKQKLKKSDVSLRLIPNSEPALNTATSHHNKLGLSNNKVELLVVRARSGRIIIAESTGAQNITAYTKRDQERPKRDAFVGMLPPKLAQIMINLATSASSQSPPLGSQEALVSESVPLNISAEHVSLRSDVEEIGEQDRTKPVHASDSIHSGRLAPESNVPTELYAAADIPLNEGVRSRSTTAIRILDPFCGTGVVLQEAALMGYSVYGTDLADKMIDFSQVNLQWLAETHHLTIDATLHQGDAMNTKWKPPIDAVVCESYLGQPFSAPPSPSKLDEVRRNCNHIISTFLKNIASQVEPGTPFCVAIPAWQNQAGQFTHLPLINQLDQLGFTPYEFKNINKNELLYYREDQIVARELLVLIKS